MARKAAVSPAVPVTIIIIIIVGAAGYAYLVYARPCCTTTSEALSSSSVSRSTIAYGSNSTYTYRCPLSATCDYVLLLTINLDCTACQFSGEYVSPSENSLPTQVSGVGNESYHASSFDSPLYLAWNISKDTVAGTLEIRISGTEGQTYYHATTSTPYGNLVGTWVIAVATGSESQFSTS